MQPLGSKKLTSPPNTKQATITLRNLREQMQLVVLDSQLSTTKICEVLARNKMATMNACQSSKKTKLENTNRDFAFYIEPTDTKQRKKQNRKRNKARSSDLREQY